MDLAKNIKERLILAALELFAEQGIHGVSMRNINLLAGTKNSGAAHYHFGSKHGLMEALFIYLNDAINELREDRLTQSHLKLKANNLTVEETLDMFFTPYLRLFREKEYGRNAIRFFARLAVEEDKQIQTLIKKHYNKAFYLMDELLSSVVPHIDRDRLRRYLLISWVSIVNGLADLEFMYTTFFDDDHEDNKEVLLDDLINFIAAGILVEEQKALDKQVQLKDACA